MVAGVGGKDYFCKNLFVLAPLSLNNAKQVKSFLIDKLKEEKAFWSYDISEINADTVDDDSLIAYTMRYLDLDEINMLFSVYSGTKIKKAWKRLLIPEGDYIYTLNRFFAWYYFGAKRPGPYVKSLQTRYIKKHFSK